MPVARSQALAIVTEARISYPGFGTDPLGCYLNHPMRIVLLQFFPKLAERWWLRILAAWTLRIDCGQIEKAVALMVEKNRIYGNRQLYLMGSIGIFIRSVDKVERIRNIDSQGGSSSLLSESREDSILDLFNYAVLAILVLRKELT